MTQSEKSDSPARSQEGDYAAADGFIAAAFAMAQERAMANGTPLGKGVFTVQEEILVAIFYLIRSRFPA